MFTITRYRTHTVGTVVNEISDLKVLIKLSVIKNGSNRELLGGIGQAQEVGFCSGKLLLQLVSQLVPQLVPKPSTAQIIYDIRYNLSKCLDLEQKTKKK